MLIGLSALSFSYRCGLVGRGTERAVSQPLSSDDLIALAARAGLQSVEFPLDLLPDRTPARLDILREQFKSCEITPVIDSDVVDVNELATQIPIAATLGAKVIRVLLSPVLEGWRGRFTSNWPAYLDEVIARLRKVRPLAEQYGVCISVENHQDATAGDLLRVCESVGGDCIGVTFDPTNALVVAEDPLEMLERVAPYVRNIHLADYTVFPSSQGWRLVRCALGEGDMNLRRFFEVAGQIAPDAPCQIELVSHSARHIRLLSDEWWRGYPPRDVRDLLPVLRQLAQTVRSRDDDWRTPWERGASEAQISFYEDQQFASSINYLRAMGMLARA